MFDKWKARQELCKVYKMYDKKAYSVLFSNSYNDIEYNKLQDIQYAITYMLCEYFDLNYEFYYDYFPYSYKWNIAYDYVKYYNRCKEAYEKFVKENKTNCNIVWSTNDFKGDYSKGDTIYNMENGCLYMYDGKNFHNMC
jgi:hypothetical protein